MAGGEEGGRRRPRFLSPVSTALGVRRALCGSWEVSPPGQDQTPTPARAGIPRDGCSAPSRMGLEEGRATPRRGMHHSRDCIPIHKPGIIWQGIWGDLGNDTPPKQGDAPAWDSCHHLRFPGLPACTA